MFGTNARFFSPNIFKSKDAQPTDTEGPLQLTGCLSGSPELGIYLRLGDPSNPKAHQASEHQDPAIHRCKSTEDAIVESPEHADLQPLQRRKTQSHEVLSIAR